MPLGAVAQPQGFGGAGRLADITWPGSPVPPPACNPVPCKLALPVCTRSYLAVGLAPTKRCPFCDVIAALSAAPTYIRAPQQLRYLRDARMASLCIAAVSWPPPCAGGLVSIYIGFCTSNFVLQVHTMCCALLQLVGPAWHLSLALEAASISRQTTAFCANLFCCCSWLAPG
jgi:hypothetical protein